MKKITILLFMLFTTMALAGLPDSVKIEIHSWGNGAIGVDSLQTYGASHYSDSVRYIGMKYLYDYPNISIQGDAGGITDTVKLYKGRVEMDDNGNVVDTLWDTDPLPLNDNMWNADTMMISDGAVKTYTILDKNIDMIKAILANVTVTGDRAIKIIFEATRKQQAR